MTRTEIIVRFAVYSFLIVGLTVQLLGQFGYVWVFVDYTDNGTARVELNDTMVHVPTWTLLWYGEGDVIVGNPSYRDESVAQLQRRLIER